MTHSLTTAVAVFVRRVHEDERVAPAFDGLDPVRLRRHLHAFLVSVLGGPDLIAAPRLSIAPDDRRLTDSTFDIVVEHLLDSLEDVGASAFVLATAHARLEELRADLVRADP